MLVVVAADLGGDGESGRHPQPQSAHLGEVRALAAEQVAHLRGAFGLTGPETVDPRAHGHATRRLPSVDWTVSSISEKSATAPSAARIWFSRWRRFSRSSGSFGVDRHPVEEGVDRLAQSGERSHGRAKILAPQRARDVLAHPRQPKEQFLLFLRLQPLLLGVARVGAAVALFLDAHDVAGAAQRRQQICPVLGREERAQGLDPGEQADEIVLASGREHGADQIVAHTGVLQMHLQPVGEERQ